MPYWPIPPSPLHWKTLKSTAIESRIIPLIILPCRVALDFIYCSPLEESFLNQEQPLRDPTSAGSVRTKYLPRELGFAGKKGARRIDELQDCFECIFGLFAPSQI